MPWTFIPCACGTQSFCTRAQTSMCDHPQAASDSATEWQQAASTGYNSLFVCVFMWSVRPERPSVSEWPARPEQTRRDRTEQAIFSHSLWLNSLFSQRSPWNCSVSLHERHPDGTVGSKASEQIVGVGRAAAGWRDWTRYKKKREKKQQGQREAADEITTSLFRFVQFGFDPGDKHLGGTGD